MNAGAILSLKAGSFLIDMGVSLYLYYLLSHAWTESLDEIANEIK
jgi:hypothetical protein